MSRLRFAARAGVVLAAVSLGLTAFVGFGQASAAGHTKADPSNTPAGNKGTVKIDDESFNGIPDNDPHPGCTFFLQFFFFPRSTTATYTFAMWNPTTQNNKSKGPSTGGSIALDPAAKPNAERLIDLRSFLQNSGIAPQPKQGWHLKLTIHAPGAQGADVKHKVFWVNCAAPAPSGSPTVSPTVTQSPSPTGTPTETGSPSPSVTVSSTSTSVAPTTVSSPTPSTTVQGVTLGVTGSTFPTRFVTYGIVLVIAGSALVLISRRRAHARP